MHPSDDDSGASMEMPRYRSHKQVWALEIDTVKGYRLSFRDAGYAAIICDEVMFSRYTPVPGDFYVVYDDGYKSFSPAKAFNEGYTRIDKAAEARRAFDEAAEQPAEALLTAIRPFIDPVREVGRDNNGAPTVHIEAFVSELETLRALAARA